MATIKKIQENGATIYPVTIPQAIKDPTTNEELTAILNAKALKTDLATAEGTLQESIDTLQTNIEENLKNNYALKDGSYPKLTAGFAEHLVGDGTATEEEFSFRPTATVNRNVETTTYDYDMRSNFGARIESVKGNSVVWNQKANQTTVGMGLSGGWFGYYSIEKDGDTYTVSNTSVSRNILMQYISFDSTHKYLITFGVMVTSEIADGSHRIGYLGESTTQWLGRVDKSEVYNKRKDFAVFITPLAGNTKIYLGVYTSLMSQNIYSPRIHDLTQMFGAGNEPTTIEEFYSLLPKNVDLNAYNEGEIVDANYEAIKTTGFNQYNGTYAKVLGGVKYYLGGTYTSIGYTTEEGGTTEAITIPSDKYYTPSQNGYIYAQGTDICINLAWDEYSAMNGTYAPYKPFERDLSWVSQYFPNGMRRAGSVSDEIRFNSTTQKWEAVQRVGAVDLGTLSWGYASNLLCFYTTIDTIASPTTNMLSSHFVNYPSGVTSSVSADNIMSCHGNNICRFRDTAYGEDAATFTTAMSGVMLNYELAEPIVTEIEEIPNLDFDVADYGTEELIAPEGVKSAPFHADIIYTPNALKTLEQVPDILRRLAALETAMTTTTTTTTE